VSPAAGRFFLDVLEWLTPRPVVALTAAERVTAILADERGSGGPPLDRVAQRLAMSTRSLRRHLAAEGTSYQRLLDDRRRDQAIRQMTRDARQVKVIARAAGFSDPRGFRRAFKRWTGLTPQQFLDRRRQRHPMSSPPLQSSASYHPTSTS
jgi:AraC-like DNA-binding protein